MKGQLSAIYEGVCHAGLAVMIGYFPQLADGSMIGLTPAVRIMGYVAGKHKQQSTLFIIFHLVNTMLWKFESMY